MILNTLKSIKWGFGDFLAILDLAHISNVNYAEIAGDRPKQFAHKFGRIKLRF